LSQARRGPFFQHQESAHWLSSLVTAGEVARDKVARRRKLMQEMEEVLTDVAKREAPM